MSEHEEALLKRVAMLESTASVLVNEVKGLRTHMGSSSHFLQIAVEDLLKAAQEVKRLVSPR